MPAAGHPVTAGLRSSLHVFGGYSLKRGAATSLAEVESANRAVKGSAILENCFGKGRAVLVSVESLPVETNFSAPDDSACLGLAVGVVNRAGTDLGRQGLRLGGRLLMQDPLLGLVGYADAAEDRGNRHQQEPPRASHG